jgi:Methyltransferase domain
MRQSKVKVAKKEPSLVKIDIGCGKNPKPDFIGIDSIDFGQKHVLDVRKGLPFKANSVDEVHSSHFVEHLTWPERVTFFNELYRVMKVDATALIITPHWAHECFYGDPTHKEPMSQWYRLYLDKDWRATNGPHTGYTCHFPIANQSLAGSWDQRLEGRVQELKENAMNTQINAWRDLIVTLTKR